MANDWHPTGNTSIFDTVGKGVPVHPQGNETPAPTKVPAGSGEFNPDSGYSEQRRSIFTVPSLGQQSDPSAPSIFTPTPDPYRKTEAPLVQQPVKERK